METCPECKSTQTVKIGMNTTRKGKLQRMKCQDCGKTFYPDKESGVIEKKAVEP